MNKKNKWVRSQDRKSYVYAGELPFGMSVTLVRNGTTKSGHAAYGVYIEQGTDAMLLGVPHYNVPRYCWSYSVAKQHAEKWIEENV